MDNEIKVLAVINEIQNKINSQVELNTILQTIFKGSKKLINFDYFGILIKNDEDTKFSLLLTVPESAMKLTNTESGAIGWIFIHGLTLLINDISKEKRLRYNYLSLSQDEKSFIGAPLLINEKEIKGAIFALSKKIDAYSEDDITTIENLGGIIVSSINKYESRKTIIATMKEIDTELHTELRDTRKVMDKIVQYAIELTHADQGCLVRYNYEKNQLECRYSTDCKKFDENHERGCIFNIDVNNNLLSEVFKTEKGNTVNNIKNEGYISIIDKKNGKNIQSQIAVPLIGKSRKPFGVLLLESINISHFSKEHLVILEALSEFGVTAFNDSRLIGKLEMLSEASNVLLKEYEKKTLEEKFDFIVKKTNEVLDAELCSLFLVQGNNLILKTTYSIEKYSKAIKQQKREVVLPIISGHKTGLTGAIAYSKKVYNAYGEKHRNHPAVKNPHESDFLSSKCCYSELAYPILDENDELIGLLCAYNKRDEHGISFKDRGFSPEFDEPLLKILTTKLIISIKNAKLVNELEKFKLIIETTPDPVVTTTIDGTMTYLNEGAFQIFGDIREEKVLEYYYSDDISSREVKAFDVMRQLKESQTGSIKDYETVFVGKDGEPVPVSASFSLLKEVDGKAIGTIGIVKDLRKIKQLMEVGSSLLSIYDTEVILNKISEICLNFHLAVRAYAKIFDEKPNRLKLYALKSRIKEETFPEESTSIDWGITGHVFKNQRPYLSNNLRKEVSKFSRSLFKDVNSKIVVPINRVDSATKTAKTFGVIIVDSQDTQAFSVNDMYYLSTLANQAAAAIENAHLISAKTKIIMELTALEKIQETITKYMDSDKILECVVEVVVDVLSFDYATISKVESSSGKIGTVTGKNVPQEWLNMAWHSLDSKDIQACVIRNKQEIKLTGWDDRLDKEIFERFNHENLVRIYLPIFSREFAFATLETGYKKENRKDITDEEVETLRKVVNLAGIGIDQAYLRKEQQKLLNQLQALNQASVYIQSSRTEEEAVNQIFRCLENIGYSQGMLSLVSEAAGNIEGRYAQGNNWRKIRNETKRDLKGNDILAVAIREKRPIFSKDCYSDPMCDQTAIRRADIKSQYVIPLIVNEKAIGTLQIDLSDKQGLVYGSEEVLQHRMEVLKTFASQIAIAIRNAKDRETINFLETTLTETAHEFRSPLHNILTQIGGLKSFIPQEYEKSKEIGDIFKIISEEAHRANRQMENTLMFTDRTRGLIGFNFEKGYIQNIIQLCVNNYKLRALERGISIVVKDNMKKLPPFRFDKCKIEQVINNLLDNAVKYSHASRLIQIQGFDDGTKIHIDFWDKGLGIPESEFDNIFKGFKRGTHKDKKRYIPGTGLGLKISKEIINGHGGQINVKSTSFFNDPRKIKAYDGYDTIFTTILPKKPREK